MHTNAHGRFRISSQALPCRRPKPHLEGDVLRPDLGDARVHAHVHSRVLQDVDCALREAAQQQQRVGGGGWGGGMHVWASCGPMEMAQARGAHT